MAFKTFTSGSVLTAADLNDYLMEQAVIACTSSTRPTGQEPMTIAETDTGRTWRHDGTSWVLVAWNETIGRPGVILTDSAQTITTATWTDITWGTEVSDVDGWTSGASATVTVPSGWAGRYAITASGAWSAAAGTAPELIITLNGSKAAMSGDANKDFQSVSIVRTLAAGDALKVVVQQNSGSNKTFTGRFEIAWLGL